MNTTNQRSAQWSALNISILSVIIGLISASCSSTAYMQSRTITLFNGENLVGWQHKLADDAVPMQKVWSVTNDMIVCQGEPMGYIYTDAVFTNYRLQVEYRWAPGKTPGNSGIFGRITGEPRPLPRCIETQLKSGNAGDLYGFHGLKLTGDPARSVSIPNHNVGGDLSGVKRISDNEKPAGEWNNVIIEAFGPRITVWLNGVRVNEASTAEVVPGPIGLQSEGGEIHFRNVRVTPLN